MAEPTPPPFTFTDEPASESAVELSFLKGQVMPHDHALCISASFATFGSTLPPGRFIKCRDGVTHFIVEGPTGPDRKLIICAHGIGTSTNIYTEISEILIKEGYTVIRYDYYNNGWSAGSDKNLKIDKDVMLGQVEDLLNFVCSSDEGGSDTADSKESVPHFLGHSTGGIVGVLAADSLRYRKITHLSLISPALFIEKNFVAKFADKIPNAFNYIMRSRFSGGAENAISDSYMKNCNLAFGWDVKGKKYFHPEKHAEAYKFNNDLFFVHKHPYQIGGIAGINGYMLRGDLLPEWRSILEKMNNKSAEDHPPVKSVFIMGKLDIVVPYRSPHLRECLGYDGCHLKKLKDCGHESPMEDSVNIARLMMEGLKGKRKSAPDDVLSEEEAEVEAE